MINCTCCNPEDGCFESNPLKCGMCDFAQMGNFLTCAGDEFSPSQPPLNVTEPSGCPDTISITIVQPSQAINSSAENTSNNDTDCCEARTFPSWEKTIVATRTNPTIYGRDCLWQFGEDIFNCNSGVRGLLDVGEGSLLANGIFNENCCDGNCSPNVYCFDGTTTPDTHLQTELSTCKGGKGLTGAVYCPFEDHCIEINDPCVEDDIDCSVAGGYCVGVEQKDKQWCMTTKVRVEGRVERIEIDDLISDCVTQGTAPPYSAWSMLLTVILDGYCVTWSDNSCYECQYRNTHSGASPTFPIQGFRAEGGGHAPEHTSTFNGVWQAYKFHWVSYDCGCPFTPDCYATQCCDLFGYDVDECDEHKPNECGFSSCHSGASSREPSWVWNGAIPTISIA